jgi:DNA-binding transcriptional LysR family regulator
MLDWNDIRFFLAAARAGSLNSAAKALRVSQPTVGRRIAALEINLKVALFTRHQNGLALTQAGQGLWVRAIAMEEAAHALERQVAVHDSEIEGVVRISLTEGFGALWLTPRLPRLCEIYPKITFEVLLDNDPADLLRRQADVAIRLARPTSASLIGRRIGELGFRLFATRPYLEKHGEPKSIGELAGHRLVNHAVYRSDRDEGWQEVMNAGGVVGFQSNSSLAQLSAIRAGLEIALLPVYLGGEFPDLVPLLETRLWPRREVWLVAHPDVRKNARVRLVFNAVAQLLKRDSQYFAHGPEPDALQIRD